MAARRTTIGIALARGPAARGARQATTMVARRGSAAVMLALGSVTTGIGPLRLTAIMVRSSVAINSVAIVSVVRRIGAVARKARIQPVRRAAQTAIHRTAKGGAMGAAKGQATQPSAALAPIAALRAVASAAIHRKLLTASERDNRAPMAHRASFPPSGDFPFRA